MSKTERYTITRGLILIIIMMIVSISMPITAMAFESFSVGSVVYVNVEDYLRLREEPQGEIIGQIPRGGTVTILSGRDRNGYYKVKVNSTGEIGYSYGEYLTSEKVERKGKAPVTTKEEDREVTTEWYIGDNAYANVSKRLILRKGPSKQTKSIGYIEKNTEVEIMSELAETGYIKVKVLKTGTIAYVDSYYLKKIEIKEMECQDYDVWPGMVMYVDNRGRLNFRKNPTISNNVLFQLHPGDEVTILSLEIIDGFVHVCTSNGTEGYVKLEFLTFDKR